MPASHPRIARSDVRGWLTPLLVIVAACVAACGPSAGARAGDWPQILGPARNGIAAADETLADEWPAEGPYTLWQREVGSGYAGVAVANKRVVLFHRVGDKEVTESLDASFEAYVKSLIDDF